MSAYSDIERVLSFIEDHEAVGGTPTTNLQLSTMKLRSSTE